MGGGESCHLRAFACNLDEFAGDAAAIFWNGVSMLRLFGRLSLELLFSFCGLSKDHRREERAALALLFGETLSPVDCAIMLVFFPPCGPRVSKRV